MHQRIVAKSEAYWREKEIISRIRRLMHQPVRNHRLASRRSLKELWEEQVIWKPTVTVATHVRIAGINSKIVEIGVGCLECICFRVAEAIGWWGWKNTNFEHWIRVNDSQ